MRKVSLIIPVYNAERYLGKCIQSACIQTYPDLEIICVDDGSTDMSGQILDTLAQKDSRIKVVHQSNQGESVARNRGLATATGAYIGFMDCDDWIEPDMYENLVQELECADADMAISGWYMEDEEKCVLIKNEKTIENKIFSRDELMHYLYERDSYREFAYMWDKLYKREILYDESGHLLLFDTDLLLGGDVLYLGRAALNVKNAVYIDKAFYHYLQRPDSGCHSKNLAKRKDWLQAYLRLISLYEKNHIDKAVVGLLKRFLVYHSANTAQMAYEQNDTESLDYCKRMIEQYKEQYVQLNSDKPDRLMWLEKVLSYQ